MKSNLFKYPNLSKGNHKSRNIQYYSLIIISILIAICITIIYALLHFLMNSSLWNILMHFELDREIQELEAALEELKSAVDMCSDFQEELFDQLSKMNSPSNTGLARLLNAKIGNSNSYSADVSLQIGGSDFSSVVNPLKNQYLNNIIKY